MEPSSISPSSPSSKAFSSPLFIEDKSWIPLAGHPPPPCKLHKGLLFALIMIIVIIMMILIAMVIIVAIVISVMLLILIITTSANCFRNI